jgi:hypothetical protein
MTSPGKVDCHCCQHDAALFGNADVLGKYRVNYYRCAACGFIQTEAPHWLAESYANPMTSYDLGGISRPALNSGVTKAVLSACFDPSGRFVDFGGGYGVFTRWMRDEGFDFWHHDKHCQNLFANGFDADMSGNTRYEIATAYEVFEHFPEPAEMLKTLFRVTDSIFFTTDLLPEPAPRLEDWWYFGPEHGQHVAFYTPAALRSLGARFGAKYLGGAGNFHLLTRRDISPARFEIVLGRRARALINIFTRRPSLLPTDFEAAKARAKQAVKAAP